MPLSKDDNKQLSTKVIIIADGQDVSTKYGIAGLVTSKCVNKIPYAQLWLYDGSAPMQDFVISSGKEFIPGNTLELKIGDVISEAETIFEGIILKHSIKSPQGAPSMLIVEAKDESIKLTVGRKNRFFDPDITDSDAIETILGDYPKVTPDIEATTPEQPGLVQYYSTDWDFIMSRADVNGMLAFADDNTLTIKKPDFSAAASFDVVYGINVIEMEASMNAETVYKSSTSFSFDYSEQSVLDAPSQDPGVTSPGNISFNDLADVIGLEDFPLQHSGFINTDELQAWSDAKMMRSQLSKVTGRIRISGDPTLKPGDIVNLQGMGDRFNGDAFVASVTQSIMSDQPWYTDIELGYSEEWFSERYTNVNERPAAGLLPAIYGLQNGIVTEIADDPGGEFRVRVNVPMIGGDSADGVWARLCQFDAGTGPRGSFFWPEKDDEVVVGFFNDDPRDAVILGRLYSSANEPPFEVTEDNFEKGIITKEELKLVFNDDEKSVLIETPGGNKVTISDDAGSIVLEDQNGNTVSLDDGGITLDSGGDITLTTSTGDVTIEGMNVNIAATSQFAAEGTSAAEVTSSGVASIKGSAQTAIG